MGDVSTTVSSISVSRASLARQLILRVENKVRLREQVRALRISILFNLKRKGDDSKATALKLCSSLLSLVKDNQIMTEDHLDYYNLYRLTHSYQDSLQKQEAEGKVDTPEWFSSLKQVEHNYYGKSIVVTLRSIGGCLDRIFSG